MAAGPKAKDAYALGKREGRSESAELLARAVANPQTLLRRLVLGEVVAERARPGRPARGGSIKARSPEPPTEECEPPTEE